MCPGEILILHCTVIGGPGGTTIWNGTAFDCRSKGIILFHNSGLSGTVGECNNGDIVGQRVSQRNNSYTSQLNVTVSRDMDGKTIMCTYDDGMSNIATVKLSKIVLIPGTILLIH